MDAITTYELSKEYNGHAALSGLNLQVPAGMSFGCVGRQGSGKTTLIRLLSGLCRCTGGECSVLGFNPAFEAEKLHAVTGTVLDTSRLYESMTVSDNLRFFAGLNGVDENDALDLISHLLHQLDIWEERDSIVDDLPTGVVRRASLARALIHRPKVLLLDEPAGGFNRETEESMEELISSLVTQEGMTVLLCTENMAYAQQLCGSFALLKDGTQIARGDLAGLRQASGACCRAVLRLGEGSTAPKGFRQQDGLWEKELKSEEELPEIIAKAVADGIRLYEARLIQPTLEEVYTAFLGGGRQRVGELDEQDDEGYGNGAEDTSSPKQDDTDGAGHEGGGITEETV